MVNYKKQEEFVYKTFSFKMSKDKMASILYAGIECAAKFTTLWNMNRQEYTRKQNVYNEAHIVVNIHPDNIPLFEELSGVTLEEMQRLTIN